LQIIVYQQIATYNMAIKQNQRQRYKILKPKASVFTLASIQYFKKSRTRVV